MILAILSIIILVAAVYGIVAFPTLQVIHFGKVLPTLILLALGDSKEISKLTKRR